MVISTCQAQAVTEVRQGIRLRVKYFEQVPSKVVLTRLLIEIYNYHSLHYSIEFESMKQRLQYQGLNQCWTTINLNL